MKTITLHKSALMLALAATSLILSLLVPHLAKATAMPAASPEPLPARSLHFPTLVALTDAVEFWQLIFTEHDSGKIVFHDREQMNIVWLVKDLPRDASGRLQEHLTQARMRSIADDLRAQLSRLERTPIPLNASDEEILRIANIHGPASLKGASQRIRIQRGVADHFRVGLKAAEKWLPKMREILIEEKVPPELVALPFVESMFNPAARSSVGAAGLWQLMPATARGLGLRVTRHNDERLDILKATRAAARMLRDNHRMLGTWPLAITAYNHGPNGIRRAVKQVGSTDLAELIDNYNKATWGFASKNFYAEFIAVLQVLSTHAPNSLQIAQSPVAPAKETSVD